MRLIVLTSLCIMAVGLLAFEFRTLFEVPKGWPKPVYNMAANPPTASKVALGRQLFYDPNLSANGTISCENCHSPFASFTHIDHPLSHGIFDSIGRRNSPVLVNLAWQPLFMMDGAINQLDMQALAPLEHPGEMAESLPSVLQKLRKEPAYISLFRDAYGDTAITGERMLKGLSSFLLTLVSAEAKYDSVQRGQAVFYDKEAKGYAIFKQHCNACHTEPLFSNYAFKKNGLAPDANLIDLGRYDVSHNPIDSFAFKTPTLRNIEYSLPYMHDGRFATLRDVLKHYSNIGPGRKHLSPELKKNMNLGPNERVELMAFLLTLSDTKFMRNPDNGYPIARK